ALQRRSGMRHPTTLPSRSAESIEVDAGTWAPVALASLRKVLGALRPLAPTVFTAHVRRRPAEWNRLVPGSVADAPDISDLALSPSERRLHKESEQTLRVLNAAAALIVDVLRQSGRSLHVENAGEADLVSLRGLMRAVEWARLEGLDDAIHL